MYDVTMPKLSDSMEVGKIVEWRVKRGDKVREGDVLAEIESDKATMELECFRDGVVADILQEADAEVPIGEVIARIAEEGEVPAESAEKPPVPEKPAPQKAAPRKPAAKKPAPEPETEAPEAAGAEAELEEEGEVAVADEDEAAEQTKQRAAAVARHEEAEEETAVEEEEAAAVPEAPEQEAPAAPKAAPKPVPRPAPKAAARRPAQESAGAVQRVAISPYAMKLARDKGVDISKITGSGPDGRIIARDIESAPAEGKPAPKPQPVKPAAPAKAPAAQKPAPSVKPSADEELPVIELAEGEADVEDAPFRMKTQARRVTASKHVIPHFYLHQSVDVTDLMDRKDDLKKRLGASVTHVVMFGCIAALKRRPEVNCSWDHGRIIRWKNIHLGLAVATDAGLTVAVLRDARDLSLADIVERTRQLVEKARAGKLSADERRHPTFTISNLGMFGIESFEPIINPPSAMTLGVPAVLPQPVVRGREIDVAQVVRLSLSCDHRVIDGVMAAQFMAELKTILEAPAGLLE